MSEYYPVCPHQPCRVCGDTSGSCSISEYGYALLCHGMPQAQKGDLQGTWKCFRSTEEYSQWEDQRVRLEAQIKPAPQISLTFCAPGEEPFEINEENSEKFENFLEKIIRRASECGEGKGGKA